MSHSILVAIPCKLSKGVFSSERLFEVKLANGELYTGISPRHFCWNGAGALLGETEGAEREITGWVAAREVEELDDNQVAVEVPDGEVLVVRRSQVKPRPTPITPPRPSISA